ncbi:4-hydroxy-tetrahydrodipicolinate synthase [Oceanimonas doudoroffii]|uniref:4-hydroxy-tetrahydrodipicolinate synthase n=1 Tax=Oceanimonas doudoroffii TaxID=84158 RepID=A0A233RFX2_9GAMM|nr:4-hydroxy-tetrahydrodipicolinate synthase [Oceanimonas doudoroffii]OXY82275.1 4-hydroxy-tetrahydrodipicolinate synthase [Oceanimonas doudoroffii]
MFSGSIVALITPMTPSGEVDFVSLRRLVDYHMAAGTHAIAPMGTTGESPTLSTAEHLDVVRAVVEQADGRLPVIGGCGSNNTRQAIRLSRAMEDMGVAAGLSVTPYYNRPSQAALLAHYTAITEASGLPQILYNVPGRTGCDLLPDTVGRLAELAGVIGIKEASGRLERVSQLRACCGADFLLFGGDDELALDVMRLGGQGVISVTANVAAAEMSALMNAALAGDWEQAEAINRRLLPLHRGLFCDTNPVPVKWACAERGLIDSAVPRLPLISLNHSGQERVRGALTEANLRAWIQA